MEVKLYDGIRRCDEEFVDVKNSPEIILQVDEFEGRDLIEAATVYVVDSSGRKSCFWVSVSLSKRNQPIVEIATNLSDRTLRKNVTGRWSKKDK